MRWCVLDLLLYSGAVYGIAWGVTRSKLCRPLREKLAGVRFVGELVQCIVCTATWVGLALLLLLPWSSLFSPGFRLQQPADLLFLLGWTVASTWTLSLLLGDAA